MADPDTPKHRVIDEYHGVQVGDDYRWLEDTQDSQVRWWRPEGSPEAEERCYLQLSGWYIN